MGGHVIRVPRLDSAEQWCSFYGVDISDGTVVLHKAVNDDFTSPHGTDYSPGTTPVAEDWDGGKAECGGGLHFSPRPFMARSYHPEATRFVGCPVALEDIAVHPDGNHPDKVKAKGCCGPTFECDIDGNRITKDE